MKTVRTWKLVFLIVEKEDEVWLNATLCVACFATQRYREPRSGTTTLTNRGMRKQGENNYSARCSSPRYR
ncbi:hypothetical protein WDZ92_37600 [Nostoc sp. NIES-2111]